MRVYELSKKIGIPNKELLTLLKKGGFELKSHMSVLSNDAIAYIEKKHKKEKEAPIKKINKTMQQKTAAPIAKGKPAKKVMTVLPPQKSKEKPKESKQMIQSQKTSSRSKQRPKQKPKPRYESRKPKPVIIEKIVPEEIVPQSMIVADAAKLMGKSVNEVILTLLRSGVVATINQMLSEDQVAKLAQAYEIAVKKPVAVAAQKEDVIAVDESKLAERLPIVVVLGHVDHGKTTLLDFIRKTRVASRERGGITQHLGAYEAQTSQGDLIFLDTPGHEAFSKIRQRGAKIADIAVIIIAADDGIMPQTKEAITHAKNMNVPIVIAVNKVDKADPSRIEVVKRELAQFDLLPEEWGGDIVVVPISAKEGTGVEQLLEMIVLQAQLMELRGASQGFAKGYILEAKLEKGRGAVATLISLHGRVCVGDYFVCGKTVGHVSSLVDSFGNRVKEVGPSVPVQVAGFSALPEAGDFFEVVSKADFLKARNALSDKQTALRTQRLLTEGAINLIIKTDTDSSKEALLESINKLSKKLDKGFNIIDSGIGNISESDIELAYNTGSEIVGLHVKAESNAASLAKRRGVKVTQYYIIYKLLEALEKQAEESKEIEMVRTKIGEATVLKVFDIKKLGVIAGCIVNDGRFSKDGTVVVYRDKYKVGEGKITSLQREKKTVKEVHTGFECGFIVDGFSDWQVDDRVECYLELPKK